MRASLGPTGDSRGSEDQNHKLPASVAVLVFTEGRKERAENVLHAGESLCGLLPMSLKKLNLEETQAQRDRTLNVAFDCGLCIHLRPQNGGTSFLAESPDWNAEDGMWRGGGFIVTRVLETSTKEERGMVNA